MELVDVEVDDAKIRAWPRRWCSGVLTGHSSTECGVHRPEKVRKDCMVPPGAQAQCPAAAWTPATCNMHRCQ
eukprot:1373071-Amphidinium_carterae.1